MFVDMQSVPTPHRPCLVTFENRTELPLTAVSHKFMLVHRLESGEVSTPARCPSGESIEFQFAHLETAYDEIEWAVEDLSLREGASYRIVVSGTPDQRQFQIVDTTLA